jgi:hypothetical protein
MYHGDSRITALPPYLTVQVGGVGGWVGGVAGVGGCGARLGGHEVKGRRRVSERWGIHCTIPLLTPALAACA